MNIQCFGLKSPGFGSKSLGFGLKSLGFGFRNGFGKYFTDTEGLAICQGRDLNSTMPLLR